MSNIREINPVIKTLTLPGVLAFALFILYVALHGLNPEWADSRIRAYLLACLVAAIGVVLVRAAEYLLFDIMFKRRKGREAPQLLRMVASIVGYAALFTLIYSGVLGRSMSGFLATSAVLSVILGLALQDTLGNFFAGLSLHIEGPYHLGDSLRIGDVVGKVEAVTWRMTAVRTNNNSIVIFPNSRVAREPIEIYTLNSQNRRILRISASYSHPPEMVIRLVRQAVGEVPRVSPDRTPVVRVADFGDSAIVYEILYWLTDYMWAHEVEAAIRERIWYLFRRHGLEIPFPIRHIVQDSPDMKRAEEKDFSSLLASCTILKPLSPIEFAEVARAVKRHVYAPGETLLRKGEQGDSMFIVTRGQAEVLVPGSGGQLMKVAELGIGEAIGEMSLLTGEPRTADVRAMEELEVLEIGKKVIERLLSGNQQLAIAFSEGIAERQAQLTKMSLSVNEEERQVQTKNILQRIVRFFSLQ
jgi:small-conductance mechanosensitive channel/CRP-like cAMP-binding protein